MRILASLCFLVPSATIAGEAPNGIAADSYPISFELPEDSPLEFRGGLVISPPLDGFGGLSGLALEGPRAAVFVSDKGNWVQLSFGLEGGRLISVSDVRIRPIIDAEGEAVTETAVDAEGLTRDPVSGAFWISFEREHRIWRMDAIGARPVEEVLHPAWARFAENTGIEALARDDQGRLWAIREASGDYSRPFPIFIWDGEGFAVKQLPRPSKHLVTGADFGPDGWLYITERKFSFTTGFDIRLRRLKYGDGPTPVVEETLLELPSVSKIDNIEAIEVWREDGETLILIASDDNMFLLQRNILALFSLKN